MRTLLLSLVAWLAARAKADILTFAAGAAGEDAGLGDRIPPNRAGRLVPDQLPEPDVSRSLSAHWALWAAAGLILGVLAVGYVRRRWRSAARQRSARVSWAGDGHDSKPKD